jgi:hypothetical protein
MLTKLDQRGYAVHEAPGEYRTDEIDPDTCSTARQCRFSPAAIEMPNMRAIRRQGRGVRQDGQSAGRSCNAAD